MSSKTSIKQSLGIGLTLGITLFWLLGVTAAGFVVKREMNEVFDKELRKSAQHILPLVLSEFIGKKHDHTVSILENNDEDLTYLIRDHDGHLLLRSHDANPNIFAKNPHLGFSSTPTLRIFTTASPDNDIYIEVAQPISHRSEDFFEVGIALLLPLSVLIPFSLIGIWWIIRVALRKVVVFQHEIEERGSGDLSPVEIQRLPGEFKPIAASVNRLLDRLRRALEAERSFTANSAHELRTPVAIALAKIQRLKNTNLDPHLAKQINDVEDSLHNLSKQSAKLLELAKAEGGGALSQQPHDLNPVLAIIASDFERHSPGRIQLQLTDGEVISYLDPDAFAILTQNLIENALKHSRGEQPIEVTFSDDGTLRIINDCEMIPEEDLAKLKNRFVRSKTKASGSGLGLAIVDAITTGAGLHLELRSPAHNRSDGFEAELNVHPKRSAD